MIWEQSDMEAKEMGFCLDQAIQAKICALKEPLLVFLLDMEIRFLFLSLVCMAREVLITPLCVVFRRRQREVKSHQFGSALRLWGRRLSPQIWNRTSATCGHHFSLQERKRSSRVCCWIRRRKSQKTSLLLAMQSGRELPVTAGGTQHRLAAGLWSLKRVDNPSQIFPPECNSCCLHAKCVSCPSPSACVSRFA